MARNGNGDSAPSNEKAASTFTPPGNALTFDGVDDYVDFGDPDFSGFSALTVEAWINPSYIPPGSSGEVSTIIGKGSTGGPGTTTFALVLEGGGDGSELFGLLENGGDTEVARFNNINGFDLNEDEWVHVALTWSDGNPVRLFVRGIEVDATPALSGPLNIIPDNMWMGTNSDGSAIFYEGQIDEVRIWSSELSQPTLGHLAIS